MIFKLIGVLLTLWISAAAVHRAVINRVSHAKSITIPNIFLGIILLIIFAGFAGTFFDTRTISTVENRNLSAKPKLLSTKLQKWPSKIEGYVNDHFGGRSFYVSVYKQFKSALYDKLITGQVVRGVDGWYFPQASIKSLDVPLSDEEYKKLSDALALYAKRVSAYGCQLYLVIYPAKLYVYPEYLPRWTKDAQSARDLMTGRISLISSETGIPTLDLYPAIMAEKRAQPEKLLYWKSDSHWNTNGAVIAANAIASFLNSYRSEKLPICSTDDFVYDNRSISGDLTRMMGNVDKEIYYSPVRKVRPDVITKQTIDRAGKDPEKSDWRYLHRVVSENGPSSDVALFFSDSFLIQNSMDLLQAGYAESFFVHYDKIPSLSYDMIKTEGVDYIVIACVDSNFDDLLKSLKKWGDISVPDDK